MLVALRCFVPLSCPPQFGYRPPAQSFLLSHRRALGSISVHFDQVRFPFPQPSPGADTPDVCSSRMCFSAIPQPVPLGRNLWGWVVVFLAAPSLLMPLIFLHRGSFPRFIGFHAISSRSRSIIGSSRFSPGPSRLFFLNHALFRPFMGLCLALLGYLFP